MKYYPLDEKLINLICYNKLTYLYKHLKFETIEDEKDLEEMKDYFLKSYDEVMNPENRNQATPLYEEVDLSEHLEKIQDNLHEYGLIIILDSKDNKIIESRVVEKGTENSLPNFEKSALKYLLNFIEDKDLSKTYTVICAHNHPKVICAIPSESDKKAFENHKLIFNSIGFDYGGDFVVTNWDLYKYEPNY